MKKLSALLLFFALALAIVFPGHADMNKYNSVFMDTFDTVITLIGFADTPGKAGHRNWRNC